MKPMQPVIVLVIALVVAAAAGYGGYYYRGTQIPTRSGFTAGAAGAGARGGAAGGFAGRGGANGGRVNGQVISATATSMTVKLADGSSKIVIISGQTSINKAAQATAARTVVRMINISVSPRVMHGVGNGFLLVRLSLYAELDGLRVGL